MTRCEASDDACVPSLVIQNRAQTLMTLKLGIVMDPIEHIKIHKDTSFALLLEAQARGYQLFYMELSDLYLRDGRAYARMRPLEVQRNEEGWWTFGKAEDGLLCELDILLMRKDPPSTKSTFIQPTF